MPDNGTVGNFVKGVAELGITGASNFVDGNILTGFGHLLAGMLGGAILGPLGILLVKANSYSMAVTERSLINQTGEIISGRGGERGERTGRSRSGE